jgi:hypothetical protein
LRQLPQKEAAIAKLGGDYVASPAGCQVLANATAALERSDATSCEVRFLQHMYRDGRASVEARRDEATAELNRVDAVPTVKALVSGLLCDRRLQLSFQGDSDSAGLGAILRFEHNLYVCWDLCKLLKPTKRDTFSADGIRQRHMRRWPLSQPIDDRSNVRAS